MKNKFLNYLKSDDLNKHLTYLVIGTFVVLGVMILLYGFAILISFFNTLIGLDAYFDGSFYISSFRILVIIILIEHIICGVKFLLSQLEDVDIFKN